MSENDRVECPYCAGEGTVKRRYGTVEPGPAKRVRTTECPTCDGSGTVEPEALEFDD